MCPLPASASKKFSDSAELHHPYGIGHRILNSFAPSLGEERDSRSCISFPYRISRTMVTSWLLAGWTCRSMRYPSCCARRRTTSPRPELGLSTLFAGSRSCRPRHRDKHPEEFANASYRAPPLTRSRRSTAAATLHAPRPADSFPAGYEHDGIYFHLLAILARPAAIDN